MCGIYCLLQSINGNNQKGLQTIDHATHELLKNRGPNADSELRIVTDLYKLFFAGYVLWQQGNKLCKQPHIYRHHVLLLNGDIFSKRDNPSQSDTEWLVQQIDNCVADDDFLHFFRNLEGSYSILYFNRNTEMLYFVRDSLGRQSLLLATDDTGNVHLSSVFAKNENFTNCIEVPPLGLYSINLNTKVMTINPWKNHIDESFQEQLNKMEHTLNREIEVKQCIIPFWLNTTSNKTNLYNFENLLNDHLKSDPETIFEALLTNENVQITCGELIDSLKNSIRDRIVATPSICKECIKFDKNQCDHAKIGLLFSGGIDCTILALLADQIIDEHLPIDLINVSFEKIIRNNSNRPIIIDYNTPDRISAKDSLQELKRLNLNRKWNLIEVNVTRAELNEALKAKISHLVYPLNSVLDESLGAVLWFGANGHGVINNQPYNSNTRVLLIGSGADELFGGYTRHRNTFVRQHYDLLPYENLEKELNFDFMRLPSRNLARDDRIIGDCSISARSPYLEETFIHIVRSLKAHQKCYHALDQGVGDKLILRLCGYRLGLRTVTSLKKRAMQFGSRVADSKQNAKHIAQSLS